MPITKKRVRLSIDEKLWMLNHRKENPKITQNKIALDFSAKFKKQLADTVSSENSKRLIDLKLW